MKRSILPILLFCLLTFCLPLVSLLPQAAEQAASSGFWGGDGAEAESASAAPAPESAATPQTASSAQSTPPAETPAPAEDVIRVQNASTGEVLEVPVLDYMIGAVASEMPITWPDEALKAQGIAAHSYALYQRDHADTEALGGAWFSVDPARRQGYMTAEVLQSYWGEAYEANYQRLKELLEPLEHTVLLYEGAPAAACYHAISNGRTEASQRVWNEALPYLQGVDSPLDKLADGYQETVSYTTQQMYDILATQFAGLDLSGSADGWFGQTSLTDAGYVDTIQVGGAFVKGTQLRTALSLRSSCFTIQRTAEGFDVTTLGYGHGVGLSQCGAQAMAAQGQSCAQILSWYFPGTTLEEYAG